MSITKDLSSVVLRTDQYEDHGRILQISHPTFTVVFDRIVPAANKYMATLFNTSLTRSVVVQRVRLFNWQVGLAAGALLEQELRQITARTAGTTITIVANKSSVPISSGISADTGSTAVTEASLIQRVFASNIQLVIEDVVGLANGHLLYERRQGEQGHTLLLNEGISIKNITSSVIGTVSYVVEFTDEPV